MKLNPTKSICVALAVVLMIFVAGCARRRGHDVHGAVQRSLSTVSSKQFNPKRVNTVAILPIANGIGGSKLADEDLQDLTGSLTEAFENNTSVEVVNLTHPEQYAKAVKQIDRSRVPERSKAAVLGQNLGVQGVLYGVISRYDDRADRNQRGGEGTAVSFKLWLIEPATAAEVWSASFDRANIPLSDNLLLMGEAIESGFKYRTAAELMRYGFIEAAKALERERLSPAAAD